MVSLCWSSSSCSRLASFSDTSSGPCAHDEDVTADSTCLRRLDSIRSRKMNRAASVGGLFWHRPYLTRCPGWNPQCPNCQMKCFFRARDPGSCHVENPARAAWLCTVSPHRRHLPYVFKDLGWWSGCIRDLDVLRAAHNMWSFFRFPRGKSNLVGSPR